MPVTPSNKLDFSHSARGFRGDGGAEAFGVESSSASTPSSLDVISNCETGHTPGRIMLAVAT